MQTTRLFEIIYILLDRKNVTAGALAEHFGVSRRTICRDIDALSVAGIPIYTERGKGGGVRLLPDFVLNKSILNAEEQTAILSAMQGLSNVTTDQTQQTLQKLSTLFNRPATNWLEIDYTGWSHEHDFFGALKTAIFERRVVRFDYYNSSGEKGLRCVAPVQLWFKARHWYLKGFCLDKADIRLYKLSRMKGLVVTEGEAPAFDPAPSSQPVADRATAPDEVTLVLRIAPEMAHRVFDEFYESMVEKAPDGSFLVTVTWPEDAWVYGFILSFGPYIEVVSPVHIREIVKKQAELVAEKY